MAEPFIGSEAVASGQLTPHTLRTRFVAIYPGVYITKNAEMTAAVRAEACWLWSRRRGVLAGFSAAALHGAKWISADRPAEVIYENRHHPLGVRTWADRLGNDETVTIFGMRVTNPARTALDIACRHPVDVAVTAIDSLANATDLKPVDVDPLAMRYRGRRGIKHARVTLDLIDAGAESPRETWLRLLLVRAGFPRPQTQIRVYDEFGQLIARPDMGWEDVLVAVDPNRPSRRSRHNLPPAIQQRHPPPRAPDRYGLDRRTSDI